MKTIYTVTIYADEYLDEVISISDWAFDSRRGAEIFIEKMEARDKRKGRSYVYGIGRLFVFSEESAKDMIVS
jgi:hypothetical protein